MLVLRICPVIVCAALLACVAGCKKSAPESGQSAPSSEQSASAPAKSQPAVENKAPPPLRGAAEVTAALQRKDYPGAVAALAQAKAGMTPDQRLEYNDLMRRVRGAVATAAATDESAKRAFEALRQIESGR
jgi:hypothetical protein